MAADQPSHSLVSVILEVLSDTAWLRDQYADQNGALRKQNHELAGRLGEMQNLYGQLLQERAELLEEISILKKHREAGTRFRIAYRHFYKGSPSTSADRSWGQ